VSLGVLRPVATLTIVFQQDLTFSLSLANASTGPFAIVASRTCAVCRMNSHFDADGNGDLHAQTFTLPAAVSAAFVRLEITWSNAGGVGGCSDLCDWATDVHKLSVWSPGALPTTALQPPPPPVKSTAPPATCAPRVVTLLSQSAGGFVLTGDAAAAAPGSSRDGAASVQLTAAAPDSRGALEFTRIVSPDADCGCRETHMMTVTLYIRMGDGVLPGEGLTVSLVDATRQTPGATGFVPGCGVRSVLPAHAISVVFDTSVSDPGCDAPGTGARVVSTLGDGAEPPLVLCSTLEMGTSAFRRAPNWVTVQFEVFNALYKRYSLAQMAVTSTLLDGDDNALPLFIPLRVRVDGHELLDPSALMRAQLRGKNATLPSFYVVVAAGTGAAALDAHAVSGLRFECRPWVHDKFWIENWDGVLQPFTPPPAGRVGRPPPPAAAATTRVTPAALGAVSFATAFCATLALLALAAAAWHRNSGVLPERSEFGEGDATPEAPAPYRHTVRLDVFLSYRRADWLLVDAVQDKLTLCGLRVFKDVDGRMAGRPFDEELLLAVRSAAVFAPVLALPSLQRMAGAATSAQPDTSLAEWLAALYFRDASKHRGCALLIHPLLVGPALPRSEEQAQTARWASLVGAPGYDAALAALPDAVPTATTALVDSALRRALGAPLPPAFAALTVRQIVLGILSGDPFVLACAHDDLGLYVTGKYAPPILRHLRLQSDDASDWAANGSWPSVRPSSVVGA
jgi:hypothetical protein